MNKLFKLLFLAFAISFFSSCVNYEEVEITDIKSLRLVELNNKELLVESEVKINNPNRFDIEVVDSDFDVKIENKDIGKANIASPLKLEGNSHDYHTLLLKSSMSNLKDNALMSLMAITAQGKSTINFEVEGFIEGKAMLVKKKVEVKHKGQVPLKLY